MCLILLNSPVLTDYGIYRHASIGIDEARTLVAQRPWRSAIGHDAAARLMSELLHMHCPAARVNVSQAPGEAAIVLRLRDRLPEGCVLDRRGIESVGYSLSLIERLE